MKTWNWTMILSNDELRITRYGYRTITKSDASVVHEHAIEILTRHDPYTREWQSQLVVLTDVEMALLKA